MGFKDYGTPVDVFMACDKRFGPYVLDAAALHDNAKCPNFITPNDNSLKTDWLKFLEQWGKFPMGTRRVWLNPPYDHLMDWCRKAVKEREKNGMQVTLLLPSDTDTFWFHMLMTVPCTVFFTRGRVHFLKADGFPAEKPRAGNMIVHLGRGQSNLFGVVDKKDWLFNYVRTI